MEKIFTHAGEFVENAKEYAENQVDMVKLTVAEKSSALFANMVAGLLAVLVFFLVIIFSGIALALGLGALLGKLWAGFLIVAGTYLLLGIVIWSIREKLIRIPVMNALIKELFKDDEDN